MSDLKIFTKNIEAEALNQIDTIIRQPAFANCKIRIMPDVHAGKGCVIGFTADMGNKVIPNIVGVDIGCGMLTVKLSQKDVDLKKLDEFIRKYIPNGRGVHEGRKVKFDALLNLHCYRELKDTRRLERSIGTLGGGNHFIEVDMDDEGYQYLIIHSGSRNLGKQVADYYQKLAIDNMEGKDKLFDTQKELCYLTGKYRDRYLHDMKICQDYALINREWMASIIFDKMKWNFIKENLFQTIHNYIDHNTNIVRKGAISARKGEKVLIPINMRDGCIIGIGKGNEDWNWSAPHGAGRIMSRTMAKETISLEEFQTSMRGIYTTSVSRHTIDESPMVYKSMHEIVENIKDTVDIFKIIKPVYNFKASK